MSADGSSGMMMELSLAAPSLGCLHIDILGDDGGVFPGSAWHGMSAHWCSG